MPPFLLFALLLRLVLASNRTCPIVLPSPRIVGGTTATLSTRSFLVSLSDSSDDFACTGSLLSRRWVLTAAHCNVKQDWKVRIHPSKATTGSTIPIRNIFVHEQYPNNPARPDGQGDIALVQLAQNVPPTATFVTINVNPSLPVPGAFARAAGYGETRRPGQDIENSPPFQVDAPVNNPTKCQQIYNGYLHVTPDRFICVGYGKNGCVADSCKGDSGGPLLQYDSERTPVQIGVVSFGLECGVKGVPGVHVRVSSYVQWMESKGAKFRKSTSAVQQSGRGSEEAASDKASITVLQVLGEERTDTSSNNVTISKVTFSVICVVAGIALIGFIILALFVIAGRRRPERPFEMVSTMHQGGGGAGDTQDKLQMAISLLQAITFEQGKDSARPSSASPSSGEGSMAGPAMAGASGLETGGKRENDEESEIVDWRQQSTLSDATSAYVSAREMEIT